MTHLIQRLTICLQRMIYAVTAALIMLSAVPAVAFADTTGDPAVTPSGTSNCSPVAPAPTGIQRPTGADAGTFSYNSCTGLWENQYYTWSPVTKTAMPKSPLVYTCDSTTWTWLTYVWTYSAATGSYHQTPSYVSVLPAGAVVNPNSLNPCAPKPPQPAASISSPSDTTSGNSTNTSVGIQNQILSGAGSGSALVTANTLAGDAATGNASAMATVVNTVQSSTTLAGGGPVATFTATINGDVQGDLVIDPTQLQPASTSDTLGGSNLSLNNQADGKITNNITLAASTGNAAVTDNTKAGSATTGNATAIANVVNVLNSLVSAGQSFVGVININGNMHGNILLPQTLLNNLIASNAPSTTITLSNTQANNLGITNTNNLSTTNNVTSSAASGSADVSGNASAGNAKTGSASTQVRVFNLTGSQVIGANCLLVFVNVSGKWIGVIFSAPAGATAAALGSGITSNTVTNAALANTVNGAITNNIGVSATTGNASVAGNTEAGNAVSGDAHTAVNLLNMNGSEFSMSGWFGILFINIFGDWYGNVAAYNPIVVNGHGGSRTSSGSAPRVFRFVPRTMGAARGGPSLGDLARKLADSTTKAVSQITPASTKPTAHSGINTQAIGGLVVAIGIALLATERLLSAREIRTTQL